jgi:hypothetical protein
MENMKSLVSRATDLSTRTKSALLTGSVLLATGVSTCFAELPEGAQEAFTSYKTDAGILNGYAWGVILPVAGYFVVIKLAKRFSGKI